MFRDVDARQGKAREASISPSAKLRPTNFSDSVFNVACYPASNYYALGQHRKVILSSAAAYYG
jgi:hypothetical protein